MLRYFAAAAAILMLAAIFAPTVIRGWRALRREADKEIPRTKIPPDDGPV